MNMAVAKRVDIGQEKFDNVLELCYAVRLGLVFNTMMVRVGVEHGRHG